MNRVVRHTVCPLLAALIWGLAFSAQSVCAEYVEPFTLNAFRGVVSFVLLLLICLFRKNKNVGKTKDVIIGSLCCGISLFLAGNLQQMGLEGSTAGKTGFITTLYIVIVPVMGIFLRRKATAKVWLAVAVAVVGMYFLCITEQFTIVTADLYVIGCAFMYAIMILCIDHFAMKVDEMALSCGQFFVLGVLSTITALFVETPTVAGIAACIWPLLYVAVFSSCVAFTLQIIAQKGANPTIVSLLLSMESVFAVLGGMVLLNERLSGRELLGCALMMVAVVLAELPDRKKASL